MGYRNLSKPRLAVLSDIHGNLPALKAVLADARQFDPLAGILVAGDIITPLYHAEVLQTLRELGAFMIQGNGENGLLAMKDGSAPEYTWTARQFALARHGYANVTQDDLDFINTLPVQRVFHLSGTDAIRIVHGSPRHIRESVFPDTQPERLDEIMAMVKEPVVVFGHTHISWQVRVGGRLALNPGAVTGPLDGRVGAQYAVLEWDGASWQADLRCISYEIESTARVFKESGLLSTGHLARAFLASLYTGQNVGDDFINHAFTLSRQAGFGDLPYVPDAIWEQAGATFPWPPGS